MGRQTVIGFVSTAVLVALSPAVEADVTASLEAGIGYSDNITRSSIDEVDETLATLGTVIRAERAEGRLTGSLLADLEYVSYLDGTYDDDLYGRVDLGGDFALLRDAFSWRVEDSWGQIRRDPFLVASPGNTENINYFATGPDVTLRLGARTQLLLSGRWSNTSYETSQRDYSRIGGGLALKRGLSERSSVGVHAYVSRVEFDEATAGADYDAEEYFLRFDTEGARTVVSVDAGYTQVEGAVDSSGSPLLRLKATRELSPRTSLTFEMGQDFSDSGRVFQGIGADSPGYGGPSDVIGTGDAFERRYVGAALARTAERSRITVGGNYRQEDYETLAGLDRKISSVYASWSWSLTPAMRATFGARYEMEEYDDSSYDDNRTWLTADLTWDLSRRFYVSGDFEMNQSDSNTASRDYEENRLWLKMGYRFR